MSVIETVLSVLAKVGEIADGVRRKLNWFLLLGAIASFLMVWQLYGVESPLWWNLVKCLPVLVPMVVWGIIWFVLGQLREAPDLVSELIEDEDGLLANLSEFNISEPQGLRGLAATVREFRSEDGLDVVFDTISGIGLFSNPFFLILAFLMFWSLVALIVLAPLILLFV